MYWLQLTISVRLLSYLTWYSRHGARYKGFPWSLIGGRVRGPKTKNKQEKMEEKNKKFSSWYRDIPAAYENKLRYFYPPVLFFLCSPTLRFELATSVSRGQQSCREWSDFWVIRFTKLCWLVKRVLFTCIICLQWSWYVDWCFATTCLNTGLTRHQRLSLNRGHYLLDSLLFDYWLPLHCP